MRLQRLSSLALRRGSTGSRHGCASDGGAPGLDCSGQLHDCWQIEETSLTQSESQVLLQQKESCAQIWPAHESQLGVSLTPAAQTG